MNAQINCTPTDREVAQIAYGLWEAEGRPEGQAQLHWERAEEMLVTGRKPGEETPRAERQQPVPATKGVAEIGMTAPPRKKARQSR